MITLQPVAIREFTPGGEWVYSPSGRLNNKTISHAEFLSKYADNTERLLYNPDDLSGVRAVTAYTRGVDGLCWYVVI